MSRKFLLMDYKNYFMTDGFIIKTEVGIYFNLLRNPLFWSVGIFIYVNPYLYCSLNLSWSLEMANIRHMINANHWVKHPLKNQEGKSRVKSIKLILM